jgi:plastocyanin
MRKIRPPGRFGLLPALPLLLLSPTALAGQEGVVVTGKIAMVERGERPAGDVGQAVVWLTGVSAPEAMPVATEMATEGKQFVPHVRIVPLGSSIVFPNHDPFNHNVFSLSAERVFDLGLYGRGEAKSVQFDKEGVVRVYCNVHAQMRGLVLVLGSTLFVQPGADGSFRLEGVPPGEYRLHAWHERAAEVTQVLRVGASPPAPVTVALDAKGYRVVQHKDKEGKSYSDRSRRY